MEELVVGTQWLADHLGDPDVDCVDVRPPHFFTQGHIPGAVNLPVSLLTNPSGGALPDEQLAMHLGNLGVRREALVIAYDEGGSAAAALLFRLLKHLGHPRAAVLDGGFTAWAREDRPWHIEPRIVVPVAYIPAAEEADHRTVAPLQDILPLVGKPDVSFVDVRSPAEYLGIRPTARRNGHIPGAVNIDWRNTFVDSGDGIARLKSSEDLSAMYRDAGLTPDNITVVYCQSGARASHTYLVLRSLGYTNLMVYSPGWQEWGNRADTPVELP